jgi:hypothetical protein
MSQQDQAPDVEQNLRAMRSKLPLAQTPPEQTEDLKKAADKLRDQK